MVNCRIGKHLSLLSMTTFSSYNFKKIYLDQDIFDGKTSANKELKVGYINTNDLSTSSSDRLLDCNSLTITT